ncbi:hypothetical protein HDV05_008335 [Chytridiales sp. JEL 0842]|nr:hypothetical protein HDV05_008335 [Chytridiales sp. JEL 0842]
MNANRNVRNLWSSCPQEIRTRILDQCDPLTQCLNRHGLYHPSSLSTSNQVLKRKLHNDIWESALKQEWHGCWTDLPGSFDPTDYVDWCTLIKSKEMYSKLSKMPHFPNRSLVLESIAMRHCWLEHLSATTLQNPSFTKTLRTRYLFRAAYEGHLEFMLYLVNGKYDHDDKLPVDDAVWGTLACAVARQGRLDDVKVILRLQPRCIDEQIVDQAAASGHLELVQYLIDVVGVSCTTAAMSLAAEAGHTNVIRFLEARGYGHQVENECTGPKAGDGLLCCQWCCFPNKLVE